MPSVDEAALVMLDWDRQYRLIPSKYPPIDLFEDCVDPDLLDALYEVEALTNPRLRVAAGFSLGAIRREDRVTGPGSSVVMAAFAYAYRGRFSDGDFGAYYAADSIKTALEEVKHARARFMRATNEAPGEIDMRVYVGEICKPLRDVRPTRFAALLDPDDWHAGQAFARAAFASDEWGIVYPSVRHPGGQCIAALRPPAVSIPRQGPHFGLLWDGRAITHVVHKRLVG